MANGDHDMTSAPYGVNQAKSENMTQIETLPEAPGLEIAGPGNTDVSPKEVEESGAEAAPVQAEEEIPTKPILLRVKQERFVLEIL